VVAVELHENVLDPWRAGAATDAELARARRIRDRAVGALVEPQDQGGGERPPIDVFHTHSGAS